MNPEIETTRFSAYGLVGPNERAALLPLATRIVDLRKGQDLRRQGDEAPSLYLLLRGWTASTISFPDGSRLVLKVHMPGDMLGSPSLALTEAADTLVAMSPAKVATLSLPALGQLFETNPRLAAILFLISQEERVFLMDRLASLGRTNTISALAALVLQIHSRVLRNDSAAGNAFEVPLTQIDVADLIGATPIHVNRTLQELRRAKIIAWDRRLVTILDEAALRELAGLPKRVLARDLSWLPASR